MKTALRVRKNTGTGWHLGVTEVVWVVSEKSVGYSEGLHILLKYSKGSNSRGNKKKV